MPSRTVQQIAELVGGSVRGDAGLTIVRLDTLANADEHTLTLIGSPRFAAHWPKSRAAAAIVGQALADETQLQPGPPGSRRALIVVENADLAMAKALEAFGSADPLPMSDVGFQISDVKHGATHTDRDALPQPPKSENANPKFNIHPAALIHPTARLGDHVTIGAFATVGPHASIGDHCILHAGTHVFDHAQLGPGCVLWPGTVVRERCILGARCILHANVVIGTDGFGYRPDTETLPDGTQRPTIRKVPHLGHVVLGDECELGACTTVDKGKFGATTLGRACKLDNHVQIGHNATLGDCVVISGCSAVAGSTRIGHGVLIGGMAAIADHLTVGDGAMLAGGIQLMRDVPPGAKYAGAPGRPMTSVAREIAALARLPDAMKQLKKFMKG